MTQPARHARYRLLVVFQVVLLLSSLILTVPILAADPSDDAGANPPAAEPSPEPAATPAPEAAATPEPEPAATPEPEPTATPDPEPTPDDVPSPPVEPSTEPSAEPDAEPTPAADPSADPSAEPTDAPAPSSDPSASVETDDYVVTFARGTDAAARADILSAAGADVVDSIAPLRMAVVRVADGSSVVATLRDHPDVSRVELDRVRATEAEPDDRRYGDQWSLPRIGWDDVYGEVDPSSTAVVAVLDTGVDAGHPDLVGQLVAGTSQIPGGDPTVDPNGHGTAMAGIIAAATDNGRGIAGIGFDGVKVMPVSVLDADGLGQDSDIIEGIVWAVDHGADVLNLSFSNPGYSAALQAAIDYAWDHDVVVVAAAGNDGSSAPTYPAGDHAVVGVSNTDRSDALYPSSNRGAAVFLAAPGTAIRTLEANGSTTSVTGTSASAAEVAAAAALLRAIDPDASNGVIVGRLARSAADVGTRAETGNGRLDLARAVADRGRASITPEGAAPSGGGGPFVGPYVAATATVTSATLNGSGGPISVGPSASVTVVMNVTTTTTGGATTDDWNSSRWALAASPPAAASMTCNNHSNHNGPGAFTDTFTITAPAAAGTYNLYLIAYNSNTCTTGAGPLFTRTGALVVGDVTAPAVTIDQAAGQVDPTNTSPIVFTVVFSEPVTGFATGDVTIGGSSGGTKTGTVSGSGTTYSVAVIGMTTSGTVSASVAAGVATDAAGNANSASTSTDNTVTWDASAPAVTIDQAAGQVDPTNTSPIVFTVVFSEPVTGFATGDVTIGGSSGGTKTGTVSGSGTTYSVAVTGMTTSGTVSASVAAGVATDAAGNANSASTSTDNTVTWDRATHLGFVQQPTDTTYGSTISPAVTVAILDASDQVVTESGATVTLTLTPSGPTLGGTLTVAAVNGIATFSGLTVDAVGTYTLDATSAGLTGATSAAFEILQADLTITADDRTKTYGQAVVFAGTEFGTSGLVGSDSVSSVTLASPGAAAGASVAGSPYAITPSAAVGSGLANYAITYVPGELTVESADVAIVVTGYSVTYDGLPHTASGTATGVFGEDLSADLDLTATTHTLVGSYTDPWTFTDTTGNYTDDSGTVDNEILQADLTITADDRTKTYGQAVVFAGTEFGTSGLVGSDSVSSVTLASPGAAAGASVAGSPYAITPSAAVGSGLANYAITYVPGELTVEPAALTVTADDQSKPAGVDLIFAGTEFSTAGLVNADIVDSATLTSTGAPAAAAPGAYPIVISAAAGTGLANYTISYEQGTLTVGNTTPVIGDADVSTDATVAVAGAVTVTDPDTGQTVSLTISGGPTNGVASVADDGSFIYSPTGTFTGTDTFTIEGCDDDSVPACATGTVTVAVYPVAVDDDDATTEGKTVEVDVQANDIGDTGDLQIVSGPVHGTAVIGSIIYTPNDDFVGTDQVVYRVCSPNDQALCDDGTLTITVAQGSLPDTDALVSTPIGPLPTETVQLAFAFLLLGLAGAVAAVLVLRRRSRTA